MALHVSPAGRADSLQGHRYYEISSPIRASECGDLQKRRRSLAGELFGHHREPGLGRHLQSVLLGKRSQWARINIRKYRDEHREYRSFQSDAGVCAAEANAQSSEHTQPHESELTVNL